MFHVPTVSKVPPENFAKVISKEKTFAKIKKDMVSTHIYIPLPYFW